MADQPNQDELTEVFISIDATQVQMAHDLLDGSGIETFIFDDDSSRMLGSTGAVAARLMVHTADADEARSASRNSASEKPSPRSRPQSRGARRR